MKVQGYYLQAANNCVILGAAILDAVQIVVVSVLRNVVSNALVHCAVFLYVDVRKSVVLYGVLLNVADGHSSVLDGRKSALGVRYLVQFPLSALDGHKLLLGVPSALGVRYWAKFPLSALDGHKLLLGVQSALDVHYLAKFPLSALDGHKLLLDVPLPPQYDDHQKTLAHNVLQVSHRRH